MIRDRHYLLEHDDLLRKASDVEDLTPREEQFLEDLERKYRRIGQLMTISDKQLTWLESIASRAE